MGLLLATVIARSVAARRKSLSNRAPKSENAHTINADNNPVLNHPTCYRGLIDGSFFQDPNATGSGQGKAVIRRDEDGNVHGAVHASAAIEALYEQGQKGGGNNDETETNDVVLEVTNQAPASDRANFPSAETKDVKESKGTKEEKEAKEGKVEGQEEDSEVSV